MVRSVSNEQIEIRAWKEGGPTPMRRSWWLAALVLAVVGLALIAAARGNGHKEESGLAELAAVFKDRRPIEPRLTGGFGYAPCKRIEEPGRLIPRSQCSEPLAPGSAEFKALLRAIPGPQETTRGEATDQRDLIYLNGLTRLLVAGRDQQALEKAVAALGKATGKRPGDANAFSDLAAARLVLAEELDEPAELIRAFADTHKALQIDRLLPEALFNQALILDRLHLRDQADVAWARYLNQDADSPWAEEARQHRARLREPLLPDLWNQKQLELRAAALRGDTSTVRKIVSFSPQDAREEALERLLGEWGETFLIESQREKAKEPLAVARAMGEALLAETGESSVAQAVRAIDQAMNRQEDLLALARGHVAYRDGNAALQQQLTDDPATLFAQAHKMLVRGKSPAEQWARLGLAGIDLRMSRYEEAIQQYETLASDGEASHSWALQGKALWGIGVSHVRQGHYSEALAHYRPAAAAFEKAREGLHLGFVNELMAEDLFYVGQYTAAWRHRFRAAKALSPYRTSVRLHNVLWEGGWAAVQEGNPEAGLAFLDEDVLLGERSKLPQRLTEALLWRSKVHLALGNTKAALADLERAQRTGSEISEDLLRERLGADLALVEGDVRRRIDPVTSLPAFTRAVDYYKVNELYLDLAEALLGNFRARLASGSVKAAESELLDAVELFENQRDRLAETDFRLSYSEAAQGLYDEMILLQAEQNGDLETALEYSERARAVALGSLTASTTPTPAQIRNAVKAIPENLAVIEYARVKDRLFTWVLWKGQIEGFSQKADPKDLEERVRQLISAIRRRAPEAEIHSIGKELYRLLIPSSVSRLPAEVGLCIVPDKILNSLPFAALRNPGTNQYLIEERSIRIIPGVAAPNLKRVPYSRAARSALLVGATVFDRGIFPDLLPLPGAAAEVRNLAKLYPAPKVLQGPEATKVRILANLDQYEIFHFAGHSTFNEQRPESSYLVVAPSGGSDAGLIFLNELAGQRLQRLQLVVLSSCESLGPQETRVAGISGLARPFLDAGVSAVVGSLWDVGDRGASQLIPEFHRRYFSSGAAAQALREAQVAMLRSGNPRLRLVDSWSVFQVVGEMP